MTEDLNSALDPLNMGSETIVRNMADFGLDKGLGWQRTSEPER